jgi:hypothetical protein
MEETTCEQCDGLEIIEEVILSETDDKYGMSDFSEVNRGEKTKCDQCGGVGNFEISDDEGIYYYDYVTCKKCGGDGLAEVCPQVIDTDPLVASLLEIATDHSSVEIRHKAEHFYTQWGARRLTPFALRDKVKTLMTLTPLYKKTGAELVDMALACDSADSFFETIKFRVVHYHPEDPESEVQCLNCERCFDPGYKGYPRDIVYGSKVQQTMNTRCPYCGHE